jgi:hypothetical protein
MSSPAPNCRTITILLFQGDRSHPFAATFLRALDDEKNRSGPRPSKEMCLLYTGHTGVSTDGGATVYGFNPSDGGVPVWQMMNRLRNREAFPAVVTNDTAVFIAAQKHGLSVLSLEVLLPEPRFKDFENTLDAERRSSQYSYGFPDGDGDCNCTTWLERLGLPLLTGYMDEFVGLAGNPNYLSRRFGQCV